MGRRRKGFMPPFEGEITHLGPKGVGVCLAPDGKEARVRGVAPGTRVRLRVTGKKKGVWLARSQGTVRPAAEGCAPRCAIFGLCGGCTLQELPVESQRQHKHQMAVRDIASGLGRTVEQLSETVTIHPVRAGSADWGYRNKVELSFGVSRYLSEADHQAGQAIDGCFLGFHAPGRFDRVVDATRCELVDDSMNQLIGLVRAHALADGAPAPWSVREHTGFWRHLVLRSGQNTGERLVLLVTADPAGHPGAEDAVRALGEALMAAQLPGDTRVVGVQWWVNEGVADVARGDVRASWGKDHWEEQLGPVRYRLGPKAFFQTSIAGATALYDTVGESLRAEDGTLLDLYCGVGSIGLYLADRFAKIVGVEEVEEAVVAARQNAQANGVQGNWRTAKVEAALDAVVGGAQVSIVVDPPRAGLHPKVARALADTAAQSLIYVACKPASMGRDGALMRHGWRLVELWTVDLFPHTPHIEAVGRFERVEP
jgi:23S rRNA (uracil1939-C5)-methyltransferase